MVKLAGQKQEFKICTGSECGPMEVFCYYGDEPSFSVKAWQYYGFS
jgi:hypothetical protein